MLVTGPKRIEAFSGEDIDLAVDLRDPVQQTVSLGLEADPAMVAHAEPAAAGQHSAAGDISGQRVPARRRNRARFAGACAGGCGGCGRRGAVVVMILRLVIHGRPIVVELTGASSGCRRTSPQGWDAGAVSSTPLTTKPMRVVRH